jgi:ELWxxDGT repeat protein
VKDIGPAWEGGSPQELNRCGAGLYFTASGGWAEGREIWQTDGTPEGTLAASDLVASGGWQAPAQLKCWSDQLYFVYDDQQHGSELWKLPAVTQSNRSPSAVADSATLAEDTPVNLPVLDNDLEPDLDVLHIVAAAAPAHGTAAIVQGRTIVYTPTLNYHGSDSFMVTIADEHGSESSAAVDLTITSVNDRPVANDDNVTTQPGQGVTVQVLNNDTDAELSPLAIASVTPPVHGSINFSTASITYTPPPGFTGVDTFTYTISDGELTDTASVQVIVGEVSITKLYLPLIQH